MINFTEMILKTNFQSSVNEYYRIDYRINRGNSYSCPDNSICRVSRNKQG